MLAHSPPFPITIDYQFPDDDHDVPAKDESGIILALSHRDRVRRVRLSKLPTLWMFVAVMNNRFPILECLYIQSWADTEVDLPVTFDAPNLCHLIMMPASLRIRPSLFFNARRLVTISLLDIPPGVHPGYLCIKLWFIHSERLAVGFRPFLHSRDVEMQLLHAPRITQFTCTNLRRFSFQGPSAYLDDLVARIRAPSLRILRVHLVNRHHQLPITVPRLLRFMQSSESLRFRAVKVTFDETYVQLRGYTQRRVPPLQLYVECRQFDWQVASVVQIFSSLSPLLSVVEQVTVGYKEYSRSLEWHNRFDRTLWRQLLRLFTNAKAIHVQDVLVGKISRFLPAGDGEPPLELLPNLKEVGYSGRGDARDAFAAFLDERQVAGCPVSLRIVDPGTSRHDYTYITRAHDSLVHDARQDP
jgi:hypothetical protein